MYQSLFFNKVAGLSLQLYKKRDSGTGVFLQILRNFKEHLLLQTTSERLLLKKTLSLKLTSFSKCKRKKPRCFYARVQ